MSYTVVQVSKTEALEADAPMVYSVRFGELFTNRDHAEYFAAKLNATPAGAHWHHLVMPTREARLALQASGTFQV